MPRAPSRFRQRDLAKALRALASAGVEGRVEIERNGKIVVVLGKPVDSNVDQRNEWDDLYAADTAQVRKRVPK